ncbi:MAG: hypothetical protein ACLP52_25915 [Streptosporangiaceae bacterium]
MTRKPKTSDAPTVQVEKLCGAKAETHRCACELPEGHVRTIDDWHEAHAETGSHVRTNTFEHTTITREHIRWIPSLFELPKDQLGKALGLKDES